MAFALCRQLCVSGKTEGLPALMSMLAAAVHGAAGKHAVLVEALGAVQASAMLALLCLLLQHWPSTHVPAADDNAWLSLHCVMLATRSFVNVTPVAIQYPLHSAACLCVNGMLQLPL